MKYYLILFGLMFSLSAFAGIGAGTAMEIRTTGAATNGGGYDSAGGGGGTDWSQQDACKYSLSGMTSSGAGNVILTASASADMVNNIIQIASGTNFRAGFYEITSEVAGVSLTVSTNQAGQSVTTGVGATGVGCVGGAYKFGTSTDSVFAAGIAPGNTIYIKSGTYTLNTSMAFTDCTVTKQCFFNGYNSSRGDNPTGANRPTINLAGTSNDIGAYAIIQNLIFTGTAVTPMSSDGFSTWYNNKFINTSTSSGHFALGNGADDLFINNEIISQAGFGVSHNGDSTFIGNYFHDTPTCYRYTGTAPVNLTNNIFADCPTVAISITAAAIAPVIINGNTLKGGNAQGTGVSIATGAGGIRLLNNIITDFSTGVSATTANTNQYSNWNDFFSNSTARSNWTAGASDIATNPGFGNVNVISGAAGSVSGSVLTDNSATMAVTDNVDYVMFISGTGLTVTPGSILITSHTTHTVTLASAPGGSGSNISYVIVTGHNFAVSPTMKRKGFPGLFNGSSTTGYLDLGAAQRYEYGRPLK